MLGGLLRNIGIESRTHLQLRTSEEQGRRVRRAEARSIVLSRQGDERATYGELVSEKRRSSTYPQPMISLAAVNSARPCRRYSDLHASDGRPREHQAGFLNERDVFGEAEFSTSSTFSRLGDRHMVAITPFLTQRRFPLDGRDRTSGESRIRSPRRIHRQASQSQPRHLDLVPQQSEAVASYPGAQLFTWTSASATKSRETYRLRLSDSAQISRRRTDLMNCLQKPI